MNTLTSLAPDARFDVVVIGSGFGASFFLHRFLAKAKPSVRILVLERGPYRDHQRQREEGRNASIPAMESVRVGEGHKPWTFTLAFGGGTNCWWGQTPRMHPSDFRLFSSYGVGRDWPLSYDDLEPYYVAAERIMAVSGDPASAGLFPRSAPFPQPPHRGTSADRMMQQAQPLHHFIGATARARVATESRNACCSSATCNLCPADAKFTVLNGMQETYGDPRVSILVDAEVLALDHVGDDVTGVHFRHGGKQVSIRTELVVLGANAIFSPHILQNSGMGGGLCGRGLNEQLGATVEVLLDGLDAFDGSTMSTGVNYLLYDGAHRRTAGAVIVFTRNHWWDGLRTEFGRWRQTLPLLLVAEDLADDGNHVGPADSKGRPQIHCPGASDYARAGIGRMIERLPDLLRPLPVEAIHFRGWRRTESHLQGTLRMGADPRTSVVDADLRHHRFRNLVVVGTAVLPTCPATNPSLTAAALALRAADRLA